jgi:hypothetical protein
MRTLCNCGDQMGFQSIRVVARCNMTHFPQFEVAISDAERAEIEAIFIELMRASDAAQGGSEATASSPEPFKRPRSE